MVEAAKNDGTIHVTVDVAGMYFSETVAVPPNASISDVMKLVENKTQNASAGAKLIFEQEEPYGAPGSRTLNTITIIHAGKSAESRQTKSLSEDKKQFL